MSSQEFYNLASGDSKTTALDAYNEYAVSHCMHPQYIRVYDAHTASYRTIKVPCGKCLHCMETKINEWVTRMYAHCEDFKYVYFITLTYTSFYRTDSEVSKLVLSKLSDAIWHYDSNNSLNRPCWRPCLLVKKHYQDFFKRLRKNTGNDSLTYVICGETGKKFGAPHFHAILFSNEPISHADIKRAWSVALWRDNSDHWSYRTNQRLNGTAYNISIGRTDFNDLVSNGTFNTAGKIKVDNGFLSASRCFAYVCKYVCKRDEANLKRIYTAFNCLWKVKDISVFCESNEQFFAVKQELLNSHTSYEEDFPFINYKKPYDYVSEKIYSNGLNRVRKQTVCSQEVVYDYYPCFVKDFVDKFSPFVEFSRGTPIGSVYAKAHLQEFVNGVFNVPLLQDKGYVLPRYFARKADEHVYGIRKLNKTFKSSSLSLGCLPIIRGHLLDVLNGEDSFRYSVTNPLRYQDPQEILHDDSKTFVDKSSGRRFFVAGSDVDTSFVHFYEYDRNQRKYVHCNKIPLAVWLRVWLSRLSDDYKRYAEKYQASRDNMRYEEAALLCCNDFTDVVDHAVHFEQKNFQLYKQKQTIYDATHAHLG